MTGAASTVEALMFGLRERGAAALVEPKMQMRLADLSDDQMLEVAGRLQQLRSDIASAWSDEDIAALFRAKEKMR
jgi:cytochrome c553